MQDVPESNDSCLIITLKVECMQFVAVSYSCISLSACEKTTCPYCWHVQESCLSVSIFEKELLSWWQMKRYFSRHGNRRSVHYKPYPDIVIVHPEPRFTTAMTAEQWREACILALVSYCNHGPCCAETTFAEFKILAGVAARRSRGFDARFCHPGARGAPAEKNGLVPAASPQQVSPRRSCVGGA